MTEDLFGQIVTARPEACAPWNEVMLGFLAHAAATPEHLGKALAADPDFALAHAAKGLFLLMLGKRELDVAAAEAHAAARDAAARQPVTARERLYIEALAAWLAGHPTGAVERMEDVLRVAPGDALAMKTSHAIRFILGDGPGMRASLERAAHAYDAGHAAHGYFLGCHAFALEETGEYRAAEAAGREAVEIAPDDAWGLHAVAHVHDMTREPEAGIEWLGTREGAFSHCNNFRFHVWWHKALMHLDRGEVASVLTLYDERIRTERTDDWRDLSNAASLLARLELDGAPVGDRWEELADIAERRAGDGSMVFADLHYVLALTGGGRMGAARSMLARIARDGRGGSEIAARMASPGLPIAEGLVAFCEGDHARAWSTLGGTADLQLAGGSHAQRDVFERIAIDAGIRSGDLMGAESMLRHRTARRAGREDSFAAARMGMIANARTDAAAAMIAAE